MFFKQFYLGCLAHASYLIGDEETKTAVVVDPQRDIEQYLEEARREGFEIRHVFLTHFHADFIAGHLELRDRVDAKIHLGARADAEFAFIPHPDSDAVEFGQVRLKVLETPGHTPEGISIVVYDLAKSAEIPYAVLTGDTLFIGDVGRPDLLASFGVSAEDLAAMLYDSLHEKLLSLPDETLVYPAHGAGSMCGKSLSTDLFSTMGAQRQYNYALKPMSKEDFIRLVTAGQPEAPKYFSHDAVLNRKERATLEETLATELKPLSLERVLEMKQAGAQLLDVRETADFAGAHLADSINIGLGGPYATWAGTLLERTRPIVLIAEPGLEQEAAMRLGRIGFDNVAGYLEGGMAALEQRPDLIRRTDRIAAPTLGERLASAQPPLVLDVRTENEWQQKRIGDSLNIPLNGLAERSGELPRDRPIVVHCGTGYRSSIATSLLEGQGFDNTIDLVGGFNAWEKCCPKEIAGGAG
ncbi:beta-lactamase [Methylocaldum marinum]|uniref:Beta-lactamase n=1 Tax=Methylocaldum marinum TaxID=1432792 RepID=A0A250KTS5_9GAMM|nr:MBL fold metallo-hydrolase [Methylocaldum marinum]BBA33189.1 beta-lactamase [Methylocaldum marinum]